MDEKEKELVRMVLTGDNSAFEQLVLPYRRQILHMLYRLTGSKEEAMDIAQESLLKCFKYLHRFNPDRNFRNWLFQIAVNLARDFKEKRQRERLELQELYSSVNPEGKYLNHQGPQAAASLSPENKVALKIDINKCLDLLSLKERKVFILRDLEGMSIRETARVLGCSNISVRVNLSSARKKIRHGLIAPTRNQESTRGVK